MGNGSCADMFSEWRQREVAMMLHREMFGIPHPWDVLPPPPPLDWVPEVE